MIIDELERHLTTYGWAGERVNSQIIASALDVAVDQRFLVAFHVDEPWVRVIVHIMLSGDGGEAEPDRLAKFLGLNYRTRLARFALDNGGSLVLCTDIFVADALRYEEIENALDATVYIVNSVFGDGQDDPSAEYASEE